jgi:hypothetical protein
MSTKRRHWNILSWLIAGLLLLGMLPPTAAHPTLDSGDYQDNFDSYPVGSPPPGWTQYGDAPITPVVTRTGGHFGNYTGVDFPAYTAQPATKWLIKDGYSWNNIYISTVLEFATKSDGAGLVIDWVNDQNFVAILANPFWGEIVVWEFVNGQPRATSTGRGRVPMETDNLYQITVSTTTTTGGQKTLEVGWDDGSH